MEFLIFTPPHLLNLRVNMHLNLSQRHFSSFWLCHSRDMVLGVPSPHWCPNPARCVAEGFRIQRGVSDTLWQDRIIRTCQYFPRYQFLFMTWLTTADNRQQTANMKTAAIIQTLVWTAGLASAGNFAEMEMDFGRQLLVPRASTTNLQVHALSNLPSRS